MQGEDVADCKMDNYIVYSDESDRKGKKHSYFLGGFLLKESQLNYIESYLLNAKGDYTGEIKWNKINDSRWKMDVYQSFLNAVFDLIEAEYIKCRIFFVPNIYTQSYHDEELSFFKLYHMFLYHSFGFEKIISLNLDRLPYQKQDKVHEFKNFIKSRLNLQASQISEIDSSKHVLLQGIDLILGGICAKLNEKLEEKEDSGKRARKTIAKEKIYKMINSRIRKLTPTEYYQHFNIGITTSKSKERIHKDKYRHWMYQKNNP